MGRSSSTISLASLGHSKTILWIDLSFCSCRPLLYLFRLQAEVKGEALTEVRGEPMTAAETERDVALTDTGETMTGVDTARWGTHRGQRWVNNKSRDELSCGTHRHRWDTNRSRGTLRRGSSDGITNWRCQLNARMLNAPAWPLRSDKLGCRSMKRLNHPSDTFFMMTTPLSRTTVSASCFCLRVLPWLH